MELIVITESTIKLTLSAGEMERYPRNSGSLVREILREAVRLFHARQTPPSPRAFREAGEENARLPESFCETGGKLYAEMFPSRAGGCELYVTRLSGTDSEEPHGDGMPLEDSARGGKGENPPLQRASPRPMPQKAREAVPPKRVVYVFESLSLLLGCCGDLLRSPFSGESAAYSDPDRRRYFLVLPHETPAAGEYLGALCPSLMFSYINEHCAPICGQDAVGKLGVLSEYS